MNILFYTPLNTRSRDIESQAREFEKRGHTIFLLTLSPHSILHEAFRSYGYQTASTESSSSFQYFAVLQRLVKFVAHCRQNQIDIVYAHLEPANFIAVLGQFLVKARVVVCRHHIDFAKLTGFDRDFSYRITYKLAKEIIVVSKQAKDYMVSQEGVSKERIHQIDLAYDFALYDSVNSEEALEIRNRYSADVLLLTVGRLNSHKRPEISIRLLRHLVDLKLDVKLLILGEGELLQVLKNLAISLGVHDRVFMKGYVNNVLDYMKAGDFMIHPSISESSCISLKEAGLAGLPSIVCKGVGDFDDIIQNAENSFLVEEDDFERLSAVIIQDYAKNKLPYKRIGLKLRADILKRFDIENAAPYYEKTFHQPP